MFSFVPAIILFPIHLLLQMLNLSFWALAIICFGIIKLLVPIPLFTRGINFCLDHMLFAFGIVSVWLIKLTNKIDLDCQIDGQLSQSEWYLMTPNHLSWLDIILLTDFAAGRIPAPKFFLKKELIWLPFVGLGAWALDMPFMQRHSREFIKKYPHRQNQDIQTTKKSCEKFRRFPTTVINFVEGSRYTVAKHKQRNSPYNYLLPPKAGGIAFTLAAMGELFTNVLDVTILYPDNQQTTMWDMLGGKLGKIIIRVKVLPVSGDIIGDYFNDPGFKIDFQNWLNELWTNKDKLISEFTESK